MSNNKELKQQRRRRLRKRHLKSEFAPLQTLSRLFHLVHFVKCWQIFLELNSKRLHQRSGKGNRKSLSCVYVPETREIRQFHVAAVHWRQRNVQKRVMHVQSCCFANLNQLLLPFSLPSRSSLLKLPNIETERRHVQIYNQFHTPELSFSHSSCPPLPQRGYNSILLTIWLSIIIGDIILCCLIFPWKKKEKNRVNSLYFELIDKPMATRKTNLCRNPSLHLPSLCLVSDEAREILTCELCKKTPGKNIKLFSSRRINTYY